MLEKTMKQLLSKKIGRWIQSITNESVKKAIMDDLIITGGCFPSMIMNDEPKEEKTPGRVLQLKKDEVDD